MRSWRSFDWEAAAGIIAAVVALVLHLLHVADEALLLAIALVILALLLVRDLRREPRDDRLLALTEDTGRRIEGLERRLGPADTVLIGPRDLRTASESFSRGARGEMLWFNVCLLMFRPQPLFDALLGAALRNPAVTAIEFILDEGERANWETFVLPKARGTPGSEKLREPRWCSLHESVSFILAEAAHSGSLEAHLSFWGEPFMARSTGRDVPRYIFHVQPQSELIPRLLDLARAYRLSSA